MSNTPGDAEKPFVDPWLHEPNHQGKIPDKAVFLGAWERDLGIAELSEALFVTRDERVDWLWSLTTNGEEFTKQRLAARASGDPDWSETTWPCGCVAGAPRGPTESGGAMVLLGALARARFPHEFPRSPYMPGLLTTDELANIVRAVAEELERNRLAAEAAQRGNEAPILKLARELGLHPRPAGHDSTAWTADCPRGNHRIMISPTANRFGCGYCRRKGGPAELQELFDHVKALWRNT